MLSLYLIPYSDFCLMQKTKPIHQSRFHWGLLVRKGNTESEWYQIQCGMFESQWINQHLDFIFSVNTAFWLVVCRHGGNSEDSCCAMCICQISYLSLCYFIFCGLNVWHETLILNSIYFWTVSLIIARNVIVLDLFSAVSLWWMISQHQIYCTCWGTKGSINLWGCIYTL